jgi:hypothetical protein
MKDEYRRTFEATEVSYSFVGSVRSNQQSELVGVVRVVLLSD